MGWNARGSSTFQPTGAGSVSPPRRLLLPDTRLYGVSSPLAWLFRLYPLNFFTCFIYSLASFTVQFFVDGIMMSSFFAPRGAPHHSDTPRHPASTRVLSLSLLLGLSPLAGITPAALEHRPRRHLSNRRNQHRLHPLKQTRNRRPPPPPLQLWFRSKQTNSRFLRLKASRPVRYRLCASLAEH